MKKFAFLLVLSTILFVNLKAETGTDTIYRAITVLQADSLIDTNYTNPNFIILDVRTPGEYSNGHIENAINKNFYDANFSAYLDGLDKNKIYLVYCQSGGRSGQTFTQMQNKHFREVYNMIGGMNSWAGNGLPVVTGTYIKPEQTDLMSVVYDAGLKQILVKLQNGTKPGNCCLYNSIGKIVSQSRINPNGELMIPAANFVRGLYIFQYETEGKIYSKKLLIF